MSEALGCRRPGGHPAHPRPAGRLQRHREGGVMPREYAHAFTEHVDKPKPNGSSPPKSRFQLIPFDALNPGKERLYLVKRLVPRVGLTLVWGPPKCGKSFWMFDLVMHAALG